MAKTSGRSANLGKWLHPKKGGGKPSVARAAKVPPMLVGAMDVGEKKKSLPKKIKSAVSGIR